MARETRLVTITDEGRDRGKTFLLTEMSADQGERWATRALLALANAGVDLEAVDGIELQKAGWAGLAYMGMTTLKRLTYEAAKPLLDEMLTCVQYKHSATGQLQPLIPGENCQVEEIATFFYLRTQVFDLHAGFLKAGRPQT